ncbi:MAG: hypothetical protein NC300_08010 [Bacteroidales bacterium]|nr:hypothetical protein [Clostridium sp.]MCM1204074.1 hypothetical protein [Bacteroidales bacterium]
MKAEKYLLKHIAEHNLSLERIKQETGIDLQAQAEEGKELQADDFLRLCVYLGITVEEVSDQIL